MAKLTNELSWSRSRVSTLDWCRRQYYFQYYLKWDGWEWNAPAEKKRAYFFSKMTDLPMLVGDAVHRTIKKMLEDVRDHGSSTIGDPGLYARRIMSGVWQDAIEEKWRRPGMLKSSPPVFEVYYKRQPTPDELKTLGAKAAQCVQAFVSSDLFAALLLDDPENWLMIDVGPGSGDAAKHRIRDVNIWALPDFVRRIAPNGCEIWDWKTGQPSPFDHTQLLSYAAFARDRWGFFAEDIRLKGFYLNDPKVVDYPCSAAALEQFETTLTRDVELMRSLLLDVERNLPGDRDVLFPMTSQRTRCERCAFREMCGV